MSEVMVKCPVTNHAIATGVRVPSDADFNNLLDVAYHLDCRLCGGNHVWFKREAWIADERSPMIETQRRKMQRQATNRSATSDRRACMLLPLMLVGAVAASGLALAQSSHHAGDKGGTADTAVTKAYRAANKKIHEEMDIEYSNDADMDFIRGMIPHHQGAIDMAKVVMQHGKDEKIRKWAQDIIREQEREIGEMREWLKSRKR